MNSFFKVVVLSALTLTVFAGSKAMAYECEIKTSQASGSYPNFYFTHRRAAYTVAECQNEVNNVVNEHCAQEPGGAINIRAHFWAIVLPLSGLVIDQAFTCAGAPESQKPAPTPTPTPPPPPVNPNMSIRLCLNLFSTPVPGAVFAVAGNYRITDGSGCATFWLPRGTYNITVSKGGISVSGAVGHDRDGKTAVGVVNRAGQLINYYEY